jgi:hypothetical protein
MHGTFHFLARVVLAGYPCRHCDIEGGRGDEAQSWGRLKDSTEASHEAFDAGHAATAHMRDEQASLFRWWMSVFRNISTLTIQRLSEWDVRGNSRRMN